MSELHAFQDGKLQLRTRSGIWQARIYLGQGRYLWRSLKTCNFQLATQLATKLFYETKFKLDQGLPTHERSFETVIREYVSVRSRDNAQGKAAGKTSTAFTSDAMLRQIKRVVKFWLAYAGKRAMESIDDKVLTGYVPWRKVYYHHMVEPPKNARLHPTDKTLQWEIMLGKMIIKFAHYQGYRGNKPLPMFTFVPKVKLVRPAFTLWEYTQLYRAMRHWITEAVSDHARYSRMLLRDYVLVLANSGMRVGEVNNLRVRDVQFFKDDLGRPNVQFDVTGKTGFRVVIPRVSAHRYVSRVLTRHPDPHPDAWLFCDQNGKPLTTLIEPFNQVLTRAGILRNSSGEKFTLYSLRHFYAAQGIRAGWSPFMLSKNMGTSVAVIEAYYGKHATAASIGHQLGWSGMSGAL